MNTKKRKGFFNIKINWIPFFLIDEEEIQISSLSDEQMKAFAEATSSTINIIISRGLNFPFLKSNINIPRLI